MAIDSVSHELMILLKEVRELTTKVIESQTSTKTTSGKSESSIAENELNNIKNLVTTVIKDDYHNNIELLQMCLFLYAKKLKEQFNLESIKVAKEQKSFFKYTVNISWHKNDFFYSKLNSNPEMSGYMDSILWYRKDGRKIPDGKGGLKVVYYFKRLPISNVQECLYRRGDFRGSAIWEKELIMKYEVQFQMIRKLQKQLSDYKRQSHFMNNTFEKILETIKTNSIE